MRIGTGTGTAGGDPSVRMYKTIRYLLLRHRQTIPFPCTVGDFLESLMPAEFLNGIAGSNYQWRNVMSTVKYGGEVINIEIDGLPAKAFWVRPESDVPSPLSSAHTMIIEPENRFYNCITKWVEEAKPMQLKLKNVEDLLHDFFKRSPHPSLVKEVWPELYPFVAYKVPVSHVTPVKSLRKALKVPESHKDLVTELLAGATLLPDLECDAWVDYSET